MWFSIESSLWLRSSSAKCCDQQHTHGSWPMGKPWNSTIANTTSSGHQLLISVRMANKNWRFCSGIIATSKLSYVDFHVYRILNIPNRKLHVLWKKGWTDGSVKRFLISGCLTRCCWYVEKVPFVPSSGDKFRIPRTVDVVRITRKYIEIHWNFLSHLQPSYSGGETFIASTSRTDSNTIHIGFAQSPLFLFTPKTNFVILIMGNVTWPAHSCRKMSNILCGAIYKPFVRY